MAEVFDELVSLVQMMHEGLISRQTAREETWRRLGLDAEAERARLERESPSAFSLPKLKRLPAKEKVDHG